MKKIYQLVMRNDEGGFWTTDGYGEDVKSYDRHDVVEAAVSLWALGGEWEDARFGVCTIGDTGESMGIDEIYREEAEIEVETRTENFGRVCEFLKLPVEAFPSARWKDHDIGDAWASLREYAQSGEKQYFDKVVIRADRDGWRDGFEVYV